MSDIALDWEVVPCGVCGGTDRRVLLEIPHPDAPEGKSGVAQCIGCGLRQQQPRPSQKIIGKYYGEAYNAFQGRVRSPVKQRIWNTMRDARALQGGKSFGVALFSPFLSPIAEWAFDINVSIPRKTPPRIVEIGCGYGDLLFYWKDRGCAVQGVDLDPRAAEAGKRQGIDIHVGHLKDKEFQQGSFDVGVYCHSLEHLPDLKEQLLEMHRVLAPGGRIHIAVPNGRSVGLKEEGLDWSHLSHPLHLWYFDRDSIARLLREVGFEIERVYTTSRTHQLTKIRQRMKTIGFFTGIAKTIKIAWKHLRNPDAGDVLRVVAKKI